MVTLLLLFGAHQNKKKRCQVTIFGTLWRNQWQWLEEGYVMGRYFELMFEHQQKKKKKKKKLSATDNIQRSML